MPATYLHKCQGCGTQAGFSSRAQAVAAGWTLGELTTRDHQLYFVYCPKAGCVPSWVKGAIGSATRTATRDRAE